MLRNPNLKGDNCMFRTVNLKGDNYVKQFDHSV